MAVIIFAIMMLNAHQHEVLELMKRINDEMGITVVMVLHDINQASRYSDRIIAILILL